VVFEHVSVVLYVLALNEPDTTLSTPRIKAGEWALPSLLNSGYMFSVGPPFLSLRLNVRRVLWAELKAYLLAEAHIAAKWFHAEHMLLATLTAFPLLGVALHE
jgi:hypothetical protein